MAHNLQVRSMRDVKVGTDRAHVLLVTDRMEKGRIWRYALNQGEFDTILAGSAGEARSRWDEDVFDIVVIDVYSDQLDGIELCRHLRNMAVIPILLFLPKGDEGHLLDAYAAGADDCIVKPISPALFLAKLQAWLRRSWTVTARALPDLRTSGFHLDACERRLATPWRARIKLSNLEFRLLHLLMSNRGRVIEADEILDRVWGSSDGEGAAMLKNVVYRLRRKLEPDTNRPRYLLNVAGSGYSFQGDVPDIPSQTPITVPVKSGYPL